jgi:hypothetical protein
MSRWWRESTLTVAAALARFVNVKVKDARRRLFLHLPRSVVQKQRLFTDFDEANHSAAGLAAPLVVAQHVQPV